MYYISMTLVLLSCVDSRVLYINDLGSPVLIAVYYISDMTLVLLSCVDSRVLYINDLGSPVLCG